MARREADDFAANMGAEPYSEQQEIIDEMREQLNGFLGGLGRLHVLGVSAGDAFKAVGIDVPSYMAPLLDRALAKAVASSNELAESTA